MVRRVRCASTSPCLRKAGGCVTTNPQLINSNGPVPKMTQAYSHTR